MPTATLRPALPDCVVISHGHCHNVVMLISAAHRSLVCRSIAAKGRSLHRLQTDLKIFQPEVTCQSWQAQSPDFACVLTRPPVACSTPKAWAGQSPMVLLNTYTANCCSRKTPSYSVSDCILNSTASPAPPAADPDEPPPLTKVATVKVQPAGHDSALQVSITYCSV